MATSTEPDQVQPVKNGRAGRWVGLVMSIGGGVAGYLCVVLPLTEAAHHETDVSISFTGVMLAPVLLVMGLILLFLGDARAGRLFGTRDEPTAIGVAICVVTAGLAFLLYMWLKSQLRQYGYGF